MLPVKVGWVSSLPGEGKTSEKSRAARAAPA